MSIFKAASAVAGTHTLRISLVTGALSALAVLAPLVGGIVSYAGVQQGSTVYVPLRLAGSPAWLATPQAVSAAANDGVPASFGTTITDAAGIYAAHLSGGLASIDGPLDVRLALLAGTGPLLAGVTIAILAVLLVRVVRTTAAREPFAPGNATRLSVGALTLLAAAAASTALPYLGAQRLLQLVPSQMWVADVQLLLWPLPAAALLLILAAAVRAGSRLRRETEGLV